MNLASAYPNSDISVGAMTAIAVVVSPRSPWQDEHEDEHKETVLRV